MDTTEHNAPEQHSTVPHVEAPNNAVPHTAADDGLRIFDDVHEVRGEPVAFVGLQLLAVMLSYSFALGMLVVVLVPVALALTLLWPYLLQILFPAASGW
ncbi:hypothetical protein [Cryobacterium sp. SO1]|uniref:hypothetical protein n=1 Tax=Cryobacterium sp. SO1 TaxID=1897061 RepID=UPI001022EBE7|nr:hypothetical protein [Cryobacterium sp. SO1]RZI35442.1 hypothetical protein BJQ95_02162 [Cryobacterium sp. SO1]